MKYWYKIGIEMVIIFIFLKVYKIYNFYSLRSVLIIIINFILLCYFIITLLLNIIIFSNNYYIVKNDQIFWSFEFFIFFIRNIKNN